MLKIGVPADILGFGYLDKAIDLYREWEQAGVKPQITGEIYPSIAEAFGTEKSRVERAIRHAIERAMVNSGLADAMWKMLGNSISPKTGKPTNGEFIAACALLTEEQMEAI